MFDAFDAVSDLRDKQLFYDSKSDIVTNVFTDASKDCAARLNVPNKMTSHSVPVHLSTSTKH